MTTGVKGVGAIRETHATIKKLALATAAISAGYLALTLLLTYPLTPFFSTHYVGESGGDAPVYVWNMWWLRKALCELHRSPLSTDFIFHPTGIGLALHTLGIMQGLLFIPLSLITSDVAASNAVIVFSFVISAMATYALARHLGAQPSGAFLAGSIYAFCPYRLARLAGHYDLLSTEWIPLFLLAFIKTLERPRCPQTQLVLAALFAAACGYANLSYLVFLGLLALVYLTHRILCERSRFFALTKRTGLIALLTTTLLLPLLISIARDLSRWSYPSYPGSARYSADLASYFLPGPKQNLLGGAIGSAFDRNLTETTVFPGYLAWLLAVTALLDRKLRRAHAVWIYCAVIFLILSLGPALRVAGNTLNVPLPFTWLQRIPLLHNLRAPSRFSLLVVLSLALLAAMSFSTLVRRLRRPKSRVLATLAAVTILTGESIAVPIPLYPARVPDVYHDIGRETGDFAVVEIPGIDQVPGRLMHHQMAHGKRIFIGFCARVPIEKQSYFFGVPLVRTLVDLRKRKISLDEALARNEQKSAPRVARFFAIRYFVIERAFAKRGLADYVERVLPVERLSGDAERIVLRVRDAELPPLPRVIAAGEPESRQNFESGWHRPETIDQRASRRAKGQRSTVLLRRPAGSPSRLALVVHSPIERDIAILLDERPIRRLRLPVGWSLSSLSLPKEEQRFAERLTLLWGMPHGRETAAAVAEIRFEN